METLEKSRNKLKPQLKIATQGHRAFIGNIRVLKRSDIMDYFTQFVVPVQLKMAEGKGFAHIEFATAEDLHYMLQMKHVIKGVAISFEKSRDVSQSGEMNRRVWIKGLDMSIGEDDLKAYFSYYGAVEKVVIIEEPGKDCISAKAWVQFASEMISRAVVLLTHHQIYCLPFEVLPYKSKNEIKYEKNPLPRQPLPPSPGRFEIEEKSFESHFGPDADMREPTLNQRSNWSSTPNRSDNSYVCDLSFLEEEETPRNLPRHFSEFQNVHQEEPQLLFVSDLPRTKNYSRNEQNEEDEE